MTEPKLSPLYVSCRESTDKRYRWCLQWWSEGAREAERICWIMLNPSTANALRDDPTIRRVKHFSKAWGYKNVIVVNLFPLRSPDPSAVWQWQRERGDDWDVRDILHQNANLIGSSARLSKMTLVAWGSSSWAYDWADYVLVEHLQSGTLPTPTLYCLGVNKDGAPKHPLARGTGRIPNNQQPILYRPSGA